mgnify:FL=1|jgi:peptidoglycan hydrolase CwlO-like protein|tara:strand:+ start:546 stop:845 length:300 start_codon:yes stop_codon:yes gene_type:complete
MGQKDKIKVVVEDLVFGMSLKTLISLGVTIATVVGMYYNLQNQITEAKVLPKALPSDVSRMEFDMKDLMIRQTIMSTQEDVKELKQRLIRMEDKIDDLR